MDSIPRNTPALMTRIDQLRNSLLKRFENLIALAAVDPDRTDRNTTSLNQFQMQVETSALIKTCEDILSLTRQMQELWLFGQLKTLEQSDDTKKRVDENAKEIGALMAQLMTMEKTTPAATTTTTNGAGTDVNMSIDIDLED